MDVNFFAGFAVGFIFACLSIGLITVTIPQEHRFRREHVRLFIVVFSPFIFVIIGVGVLGLPGWLVSFGTVGLLVAFYTPIGWHINTSYLDEKYGKD